MNTFVFRVGQGAAPAPPPGIELPYGGGHRDVLWQRVRELRTRVFVDEQKVSAALEFDGLDDVAIHVALSDGNIVVGATRILMSGDVARIGRMAVLADRRREGLGRRLVTAAIDVSRLQGAAEAALHAQSHARGFYEALGFVTEGPCFEEAGIEHVAMRRVLAVTADPV